MNFSFASKKVHHFIVFNFILLFFSVQLFSMQKQVVGEGYFSTGSISDPQHVEAFYNFIKELPKSSQQNLNSFIDDYKKNPNARDLNATLRFGYLKGQNGNLEVQVGFGPSNDSFEKQHTFVEGDYSYREEKRILFYLDELESENKIDLIPIKQKKERPQRKASCIAGSTQDAIDNVRSMGSNRLTPADVENRSIILGDVESRLNEIKLIDLSDLDKPTVEQAIDDIDELLEIAESRELIGNLAPWRAIRRVHDEVTAIDGIEFENKQHREEQVKKIPIINNPIFRWVARKIGSHKDKWALIEALKHSKKLLGKSKNDLEIGEVKNALDNINNTITKIVEDSVDELEGEGLREGAGYDDTDVIGSNAGGEGLGESVDDDVSDISNSNDNNSRLEDFGYRPNGVVEKIAYKLLDITKSPTTVMNLGRALHAGVQEALSYDKLAPIVKNAAAQIKNSFEKKSLIEDYEKKRIESYEAYRKEKSHRESFNSNLSREEKFKRKLERKELERFVESKIIYTRIETDNFYKECKHFNISRHDDPFGYYSNEYSKETCKFVKRGLDVASDFHLAKKYNIANDFTDFSSSLLNATKSTAKFFKLAGEGSLQALSKYKNPLNVIKEFGEGFVNLGIGLSKLTLKFAEYNYNCITNPEMAARQAANFINSTAKKLNRTWERFASLPYEEKVVFTARILTDCLVDGAVMGGAFKFGSKAGKFLKAIPILIEKEAGVAKLAGRLLRDKASSFKEAMMPFGNAVMETSEYLQVAGANGIKISKASLDVVSRNKGLITSDGGLGKAVSKVIKKTKKVKKKPVNLASRRGAKHKIVDPSPRTPVGRRGQSGKSRNLLEVYKGGKINGRVYTDHAITRMNERGFTPSVIENTIKNGIKSPGNKGGTFQHMDVVNKLKVITNNTGDVVSIFNVTI